MWEHLKLIVIPITFLGILLEIINFNDTKISSNFWYNIFKSILLGILIVILGHYTFEFIFQKSFFAFDIALYVFAIITSSIYIYKQTYIKEDKKGRNALGIIFICLTILIFIVFTIIPPNLNIFKDPITNTFGIYMLMY